MPSTPDGKSISCLNAVKHGCCSKTVILSGENEEEFNEIKDGWLADYDPQTAPALTLVLETVKAHWILLRTQRWYNHALSSICQSDPALWTEEQHKTVERFTRYRTTAERAFHRHFNDLEQLRKSRNRETAAAPKQSRDRQEAESSPPPTPPQTPPPPPPSRKEALFHAQNAKKNLRKIQILDQWAEITIDEHGNTVTTLVPSNQELIKEGQAMDPPPELVYRRFNFVNGVPPEYHWVTPRPERRARGGMATQRMTVETWLETIDREAAAGTGHIGPCGKLLPRPQERGGCDCPVCTKLTAEADG
jgi:hypothetical protein